jgi:hypothetical protein
MGDIDLYTHNILWFRKKKHSNVKVCMIYKKYLIVVGVLVLTVSLLDATPAVPVYFQGCKNQDIYLTQIDNYNYLTWSAPETGPQPASYEISRANFTNHTIVLVATVSGSGILEYYDHDRDPSVNDEYEVVAVYANGGRSHPVITTVTENCH